MADEMMDLLGMEQQQQPDLLGMGQQPQQAPADLLGLDGTIKQLSVERDRVMGELSQNPGMDVKSALGRLVSAAVPALLSGGGRNLGYAASAGANMLKGRMEDDRDNRKTQQALKLRQLDQIDSRIGGLEKSKAEFARDDKNFKRGLLKDGMKMQFQREERLEGQDFKKGLESQKMAARQAFEWAKMDAQSDKELKKIEAEEKSWEKRQNYLYKLKEDLEGFKADKKAKGKNGKREVTEKTVLDLGTSNAAIRTLENMDKQHELISTGIIGDFGRSAGEAIGGKVGEKVKQAGEGVGRMVSNRLSRSYSSLIGGTLVQTDEYLYDDSVRKAAQVVGKYLEGGKLTDKDYEDKYVDFFPKAGDTEKSRRKKLEVLKEMIDTRKNTQIDALSSAGFDVEPFMQKMNAEKNMRIQSIRQKLTGGQ